MILLIIGSVLLLFGIFVFFKKNEGETEISLLGAKVKSNNSAILLITLGAVIAAFGGNQMGNANSKQPIALDDTIGKNSGSDTTENSGIHPIRLKQPEINNSDLLVGSWQLSQSLSGEKALTKMFGSISNVPTGVDNVMVVAENKATFTRAGNIDFDSDLLCQFKDANNTTYDLKLRISYTGKWKIDDDQLWQTIVSSSIVPTNDLSRTLFDNNQPSLKDFGYAPGTTEAYEILHLNESSLTIKEGRTGEKITWSRTH